jgi:hypothetical protein
VTSPGWVGENSYVVIDAREVLDPDGNSLSLAAVP